MSFSSFFSKNVVLHILYNKFKDTFFLVDSLATVEYQNEFAKIYAATAATSWLTVRLSRNFLLDETDWVFVEDSGVSADDKELYKTYRKKLRDLPADANTTDAAAVKFPINPQYFKDIYLKKNASATYLGDDGQFVKLSEHYGTTFREKMTAYLIVRSMTDGIYNKTFMSALKTAGMVYDPNESVVKYGETLAGYTTEQVDNNIAIGYDAMGGSSSTTGDNNIAMGQHAMDAITTGACNVAIGGMNTLGAITTGSRNIAIGDTTLAVATTGSHNIALGNQTMGASDTTGDHNIAL